MRNNPGLIMALAAGLMLAGGAATPAQANPFKNIGKVIERAEREAAEFERKSEQAQAAIDSARRVAGKINLTGDAKAPGDANANFAAEDGTDAYDYSAPTGAGAAQYGTASAAGTSSASQIYRDVVFPMGELSFADQIVSYDAGRPLPSEPHRGAEASIGAPDWTGGSSCRSQQACTFTSLGSGGVLVVQFTDNVLTGSGSSDNDLWIFEVGPDVEDMSVEISMDGTDWLSAGAIGGGKAGVDIDAFGYGPDMDFSFVRLTDDPAKGQKSGRTAGADIDAVGAISTRMVAPETCTCP